MLSTGTLGIVMLVDDGRHGQDGRDGRGTVDFDSPNVSACSLLLSSTDESNSELLNRLINQTFGN